MRSHVAHVIELLRSEESVADYAAKHGLDEAQLREWKDAYLAGAASTLRPSRWRYGVLGALVVMAAIVPAQVLAGNCAAVVPAPLVTMCPDEPAKASEINGNFKALADLIINRTGAISGATASQQDIHQKATAVWYADDGVFNLQANQVQLQTPSGNANGYALSGAAGDALLINEGNSFSGGTFVQSALTVSNTLTAQAAGFNGFANFAAGASFYNVEARFKTYPPQIEAGLAMNQCQWVGSQQNHWGINSEAVCPSGWFVNGVRCMTNGQSENPSYTTFCQSFCCHP